MDEAGNPLDLPPVGYTPSSTVSTSQSRSRGLKSGSSGTGHNSVPATPGSAAKITADSLSAIKERTGKEGTTKPRIEKHKHLEKGGRHPNNKHTGYSIHLFSEKVDEFSGLFKHKKGSVTSREHSAQGPRYEMPKCLDPSLDLKQSMDDGGALLSASARYLARRGPKGVIHAGWMGTLTSTDAAGNKFLDMVSAPTSSIIEFDTTMSELEARRRNADLGVSSIKHEFLEEELRDASRLLDRLCECVGPYEDTLRRIKKLYGNFIFSDEVGVVTSPGVAVPEGQPNHSIDEHVGSETKFSKIPYFKLVGWVIDDMERLREETGKAVQDAEAKVEEANARVVIAEKAKKEAEEKIKELEDAQTKMQETIGSLETAVKKNTQTSALWEDDGDYDSDGSVGEKKKRIQREAYREMRIEARDLVMRDTTEKWIEFEADIPDYFDEPDKLHLDLKPTGTDQDAEEYELSFDFIIKDYASRGEVTNEVFVRIKEAFEKMRNQYLDKLASLKKDLEDMQSEKTALEAAAMVEDEGKSFFITKGSVEDLRTSGENQVSGLSNLPSTLPSNLPPSKSVVSSKKKGRKSLAKEDPGLEEGEFSKLQEEIDRLKAILQKEKEDAAAIEDRYIEKTKELRDELAAKTTQLSVTTKQLDDAKVVMAERLNRLMAMEGKSQMMEKNVEKIKTELSELQERDGWIAPNKHHDLLAGAVKEARDTAKSELSRVKSEILQMTQVITKLKEDVAARDQKLYETEQEIQKLQLGDSYVDPAVGPLPSGQSVETQTQDADGNDEVLYSKEGDKEEQGSAAEGDDDKKPNPREGLSLEEAKSMANEWAPIKKTLVTKTSFRSKGLDEMYPEASGKVKKGKTPREMFATASDDESPTKQVGTGATKKSIEKDLAAPAASQPIELKLLLASTVSGAEALEWVKAACEGYRKAMKREALKGSATPAAASAATSNGRVTPSDNAPDLSIPHPQRQRPISTLSGASVASVGVSYLWDDYAAFLESEIQDLVDRLYIEDPGLAQRLLFSRAQSRGGPSRPQTQGSDKAAIDTGLLEMFAQEAEAKLPDTVVTFSNQSTQTDADESLSVEMEKPIAKTRSMSMATRPAGVPNVRMCHRATSPINVNRKNTKSKESQADIVSAEEEAAAKKTAFDAATITSQVESIKELTATRNQYLSEIRRLDQDLKDAEADLLLSNRIIEGLRDELEQSNKDGLPGVPPMSSLEKEVRNGTVGSADETPVTIHTNPRSPMLTRHMTGEHGHLLSTRYYFRPSKDKPIPSQVKALMERYMSAEKPLRQNLALCNWAFLLRKTRLKRKMNDIESTRNHLGLLSNTNERLFQALDRKLQAATEVWRARIEIVQGRLHELHGYLGAAMVDITNHVNQNDMPIPPDPLSNTEGEVLSSKAVLGSGGAKSSEVAREGAFQGESILPSTLGSTNPILSGPGLHHVNYSALLAEKKLKSFGAQQILTADALLRVNTVLPWFPKDYHSMDAAGQRQVLAEVVQYCLEPMLHKPPTNPYYATRAEASASQSAKLLMMGQLGSNTVQHSAPLGRPPKVVKGRALPPEPEGPEWKSNEPVPSARSVTVRGPADYDKIRAQKYPKGLLPICNATSDKEEAYEYKPRTAPLSMRGVKALMCDPEEMMGVPKGDEAHDPHPPAMTKGSHDGPRAKRAASKKQES